MSRGYCGQCGQIDAGVHTCSPQVALRLILPDPPSANRWWRRAGTHMHLSTEARRYKAAVAQSHARMAPLDGPVAVSLTWYRARRAGDLDKRLGIVLDALQGVAYTTDAQIVRLSASRHDDKHHPRVEVEVTRANPEELSR